MSRDVTPRSLQAALDAVRAGFRRVMRDVTPPLLWAALDAVRARRVTRDVTPRSLRALDAVHGTRRGDADNHAAFATALHLTRAHRRPRRVMRDVTPR